MYKFASYALSFPAAAASDYPGTSSIAQDADLESPKRSNDEVRLSNTLDPRSG